MYDVAMTIVDIGFTCALDGPGQRMVVYAKGCNCRCPWCAAPETMAAGPEVLCYPHRLADPARLAAACPYGAMTVTGDTVARAVTICRACSDHPCVTTGYPACVLVGRRVTVAELLARAERYRPFFAAGGGVTLGGGEPTCQYAAARALLHGLHAAGIHTALETNGTHPDLPALFDALDLLLIDLKHPDPAMCAAMIGQSCAAALANIRARAARGQALVVRIPLIPGFNADAATLQQFGEALSAIGPLPVQLLPYHRRGAVKWRALGLPYPAEDTREPSADDVQYAGDVLRPYGLTIL